MDPASLPNIPSTPSAPVSFDGYSIDNTLGMLFIGNLLGAILFAVTSVQTYIYFQRNPKDARLMKNLVFFLWSLDALHFAFATHTVYNYAITNFLNPLPLFSVSWSLAVDMSVGGTSDLIVTSMLAHRIWKFGGERAIVRLTLLVIAFGSLVILAGDVAINILSLRGSGTYLEFESKYGWLWYTTFGVRAGVDVIMALAIYFMMHKYRSGFDKTNSVVRVIILYSVNTCALTTAFTILSVVLFATQRKSFVGFAIGLQLPKLMLNSLLAILNSRQSMREMYGTYDSMSMRPVGGSRRGYISNQDSSFPSDNKVFIEVNTHTATDFEGTASKVAEVGRAF